MRIYQSEAATAIAESVATGAGRQFAVVFSRQSGKDELLAQLLVWLLVAYSTRGGTAVVVAPTLLPQGMLMRDRLWQLLQQAEVSQSVTRNGFTIELDAARVKFLSASPQANVRGQTADLLLVANEAQDIEPAKWDAVFDPMAASTNATTLFMGTVWHRDSLLSRQMRYLEAQPKRGRVFRVPWQRVATELPRYGERVRQRIAQFGEDHPFLRTEYFLEELDGEGGLFPPARIAQMQGTHPRRHAGEPGKRYALLLDVAGEEEAGGDRSSWQREGRRDSTALTVVEFETAGAGHTHYRVVDRLAWTGTRHTMLHDQLVDLARNVWQAIVMVVDATGVGAGLASFLVASLGSGQPGRPAVRVIPFVFSSASKNDLGWTFLGLIDSGRFKEYADDSFLGNAAAKVTAEYWQQLRATTYEIGAGPGQRLRWGVPAGAGHDDLVISAALCGVLESVDLRPRVAIGS